MEALAFGAALNHFGGAAILCNWENFHNLTGAGKPDARCAPRCYFLNRFSFSSALLRMPARRASGTLSSKAIARSDAAIASAVRPADS